MIFKGSGDCTKVDWTFLGLSIANWSLIWFAFFIVVAIVLVARQLRHSAQRPSYA
jgi:disulfide bond formation protein DsbB